MATRTSSKTVVFRRPFILDGMSAVQPAGTYAVDTEEEELDLVSVVPWRRVQTVMRLIGTNGTEYFPVSPEQLHEALMRDGAQDNSALPLSWGIPMARRNRARATRQRP